MRGHIRRRGSAWELRAYVGLDPVSGKHKYATRTFRGGKREAEEAIARMVTEVGGGGHAAHDATVADLVRQWLDLVEEELSPSTLRGYQRIVTSYILPALGGIPLARLRTAQLDRFYAELRDRGGKDASRLAPATVRQTHAILRRALQQGMRWGWISTNPAVLASPPRLRSHPIAPPAPADVIRLIDRAEVDRPELGCFLLLAATTGARRGELCALRWSDVDFAGALTIQRSIVETVDGKIIEKDTKTHASRRIALDGGTAVALSKYRSSCDQRASACGVVLAPTSYVFSRDVDGARPWVPNEVTKAFIRLRREVGLDSVRLHDFRHFAATRMLAEGVPVRTVSGRLGHANASTTLSVYAHFVEESDREAAAKLGSLLTRERQEGGSHIESRS